VTGIAEGHVEEAALHWLAELGYAVAAGPDIGPDGSQPERGAYGETLLLPRLRAAIARLNPTLAPEAQAAVLAKVVQSETPSLIEENRRLHRYLVEGLPVEVRRPDGSIGGEYARLIDLYDVAANDWLAVNQFTVIENKANRRPDVVLMVNGLPLGVIELKNPGDENATLDGAFNQLQTYKAQVGALFRANVALVISDGLAARIGSLTADRERFMPWRTITGDGLAPKGGRQVGRDLLRLRQASARRPAQRLLHRLHRHAIRAARARGEEAGLSDEEVAFYDALAENESARQLMGEPALRVIAHELVTIIKGNMTVDWMHRDSARANIRRLVKRLLRKYGYPPDLQDAAVQNVLQQAEALSAEWAS